MNRIIFILLLSGIYLLPNIGQAQVINTETKRKSQNEDGWIGKVDFGFSLIKNTREIVQLTNHVDLQWTKNKNRLILLNDLRIMTVNKTKLLNRGFQHVRYNYEAKPYLIPEAFVQAQYNQLWNLELRFLAGLGPRFRIHRSDSSRLYVGTLVMYEYEQITGGVEINRDIRLSSYVSAGFAFSPTVSIDHITYFQPRLDKLSDYRVSTSTYLKVGMSSWLAIKTGFSLSYDTQPPTGLQNTFYSWINALSFNF